MQTSIISSAAISSRRFEWRGLASLPTRRPVGPRTQPACVEHHRAAPRTHDDQRPRLGSVRREPIGQEWVGQLDADPVLAKEIPPPWAAILSALAGWLILAASRTSYPVFFRETPRPAPPRVGSLRVAARRDSEVSGAPFIPATLTLSREAGAAPTLVVDGSDSGPVRLHSAFTGISAGELRGLSASEPALCLRRSSDDLTITFASRQERDAVLAALVAEAEARLRARPGSGGSGEEDPQA